MTHLDFLNNLMSNGLAINPARILLYILENPDCRQREMLKPLNISRPVLSQCMQTLILKGYVYQQGEYIDKVHNLTGKGIKLIQTIKTKKAA